jgi:hypothetical protein
MREREWPGRARPADTAFVERQPVPRNLRVLGFGVGLGVVGDISDGLGEGLPRAFTLGHFISDPYLMTTDQGQRTHIAPPISKIFFYGLPRRQCMIPHLIFTLEVPMMGRHQRILFAAAAIGIFSD